MTIDVAKLRSLARYQNDAVITAEEITELLDAYEERDRLRQERDNLIARALRDGGQRHAEIGTEAALAEADVAIATAFAERDRLRAALVYYAEPRNHHDDYLHTNDSYDDLKLPGSRARAALEGRE